MNDSLFSRSFAMGRSKSRSLSSGSDRFQEENCQFDPVSKGYRIHLADLPDNPDEAELMQEFERYGPLSEKPWVSRSSPCYGFVVFKLKEDAFDACRKMDNKFVCGVRIRTSFALPRNQGRAAGGPGVPRCYQCGRFGHYSRECKPKVTRAVRDDSSSSEERSPSRTPEREKQRRGRYSRSRSGGRRSRSRSGGGRGGGGRRGGGNSRSRSRSGGTPTHRRHSRSRSHNRDHRHSRSRSKSREGRSRDRGGHRDDRGYGGPASGGDRDRHNGGSTGQGSAGMSNGGRRSPSPRSNRRYYSPPRSSGGGGGGGGGGGSANDRGRSRNSRSPVRFY